MSYVATKAKFHVALDGVGLILQGAPDRLAYSSTQAPVYNARFGEGDRSYTDFSFWWFFAQTDWSGGFKDTVSWEDDAKFFFSTNIDTWSEPGSIKLAPNSVEDEDFTEDLYSGCVAEVAGVSYKFVGTNDASGDSRPNLYRAAVGQLQAWTEILGTNIDTTQNIISQLFGRAGYLWILTVGAGNTDVVQHYSGSVFVDCTSNINTGAALTYQPQASRCGCEYNGINYVFVDNFSNNQYALVKTSSIAPSTSGEWSLVFEKLAVAGRPVDAIGFNGTITYLINNANSMELWQWDIANSTNTLLRKFGDTSLANWGMGGKLLIEQNGVLIITVPQNEVWELTSSGILTRLYKRTLFKANTLSGIVSESTAHLANGAVLSDDKVWWGNLMYDGANFHNTWKNVSDSVTDSMYPLFSDLSGNLWFIGSADISKLYYIDLDGSVYKGTADKNYLIYSNFDLVSGLDKLAYSVTLLFKPLIAGQSIVVEYFLGEMAAGISWTTLGTASFTADGGTVRDKTFLFPVGTVFKKLWFRVKLNGSGTDTPVKSDLIMSYLPIPAYKKQWALNVNAGDEVKGLDGILVETTGRELKSRLERAWWTKSVLDYQDVDYATTALNGALSSSATTITVDNTYDFPEQGRLRIEDEEMTYTGKTPTSFTGVTRGARDTRAVAHSDDTVINNAYKVIITELKSQVPIMLQDKDLEYQVGIFIREV